MVELSPQAPRLIGSQWRIFVGFAGLFAFGLLLVWVFRRPPAPATATTYAMAIQIVVCGLLAITSDRTPRRWLSAVRLILLATLGSLAAFSGYFFGPNSGVAGYIGVALAFAGLRAGELDRSSRIEGWVIYVTVAGGQATVITLVLIGVIPDSSLASVFVRDSPPLHHATNHVAIQVVYLACFIAGTLLQRRYRTLVGEYDELVRSTSLKEALIAEAKADYQHALRVAGDGLLSGQRVADLQLGRVVRREGRREVYEVIDGEHSSTSVISMSSTGFVVDTKQITNLIETEEHTAPDAPAARPAVAADTPLPATEQRDGSIHTPTPMPDLATTTTHVLRAAYLQKIVGLYVWVAMLCIGGGALLTLIAWDGRVLAFGLACIALILVAAAIHWRLNKRRKELVDWPVILMSGLSLGPGAVFGIHSGFTVVVVSIMFVAGAFRSDRGNVMVPLAAMATHAAYFALQYTHVIPDLGYVPLRFAGAPWWEPLAYHGLVQLVFIGPFLAGRFVDRRHAELRVRVAEAAHEAAQKTALLVAARADLDRLLSRQNEGLFTGQQIGPYRAGPLLGRGGMGEVYEARSVADDRRVALKVIRRERIGDPRALKMFLDERDAVSRVRSGYVANVIEAAMPEHAMPYIAMEYIEGSSLSTVLQSTGRLTLDQTRVLVDDVCRGLADVHGAGVLHRDVKPQNIMRTNRDNQERWMLIDFGIARLADAARESLIVGTLAYMAPEQALGETVDARADLYSLSLVIYRVLTGRPAFSDAERSDPKHAKRLPPDPGYFVPIPLDVALVLRIGLAQERNDRFANATELQAAFAAACEQRLSTATRERARRLLEQELWPSPTVHAPPGRDERAASGL